MQSWQSVFLDARELSREISAFELEAFFTFSEAERQQSPHADSARR